MKSLLDEPATQAYLPLAAADDRPRAALNVQNRERFSTDQKWAVAHMATAIQREDLEH
jgi:hypothetical protein